MAELVHRLDLHTVTLKVRLPRALPVRIWLGTKLIIAAAWVIGCGVEIDTKAADE